MLLLLAGNMFAQPLGDAMKLMEMKQYKSAKSAFLYELKNSNSAPGWFYLGKIYSLLGQPDSAKICFSLIEPADPKSSLLIVAQAINELSSGNNSQAFSTLDKAQRYAISKRDINALVEIAPVRYQAGDTIGWMIPLTLASGMDSKNPQPYIMAGKIYLMTGERFRRQAYYSGLASGRFEQALYNDPGNLEALTAQAESFLAGHNFEQAEEYLNIILEKDSNYIPALRIYGELAYTLGKYDKASLFYSRYMALSEYNNKDITRFITILYFNKEYEKVNGLIESVLAKQPSNGVMLRLKGYTSFELGKYPEGYDAMKKFFDLRATADTNKIIPTDYEYAGKLSSKIGNDSLSIIYLLKAVEMDSTKAGLYEDISKLYEKIKQYQNAIEFYNRYISARNGNVASVVYFNIGKDWLMLANDAAKSADSLSRPVYLQRADTAFRKVIELSPNSHLGYQWHARVLAAFDPETELGLAKTDYEKTLSILEQKNDLAKYKIELIEGYRFMGYYYYLQYESAKLAKDDAAMAEAKSISAGYWQKILSLEPENDVAKQAIKALK
jgi:tetratricopeptide (TPR) repeat protein